MVKIELGNPNRQTGFRPVYIVLETEEETNLVHHIMNFCPNKERFYSMTDYKATFEEINSLRHDLWELLDKIHHLR